MSKRKSKSIDVVAKIMATPVARQKMWVDKLTPENREVIVRLRQQWRDGNFPPGVSLSDVHRATCRELGIKIGRRVFSEYFNAD